MTTWVPMLLGVFAILGSWQYARDVKGQAALTMIPADGWDYFAPLICAMGGACLILFPLFGIPTTLR